MAYGCTRCGLYHIGRRPTFAPPSRSGIDHPYSSEGTSPRRICCAKPEADHPA